MRVSEKSIFFFADAAQETHTGFKKVLRARSKVGFLSLFLNHVSTALREEIACLNPLQRQGLPQFHQLSDLCSPDFEECRRHPALHLTETVLVQLANFILYYENRPEEPWFDRHGDLVVGVCVGEISAAAVSLSSGLADLIPNGVAAVRIAFRAGLHAAAAAAEVESNEFPARPWTASIPRTTAGIVDEETLRQVAKGAGLTGRGGPWLVSQSENRISVGAAPTVLRQFLSYVEQRHGKQSLLGCIDVQIYAPYHSPTIFTRDHARQILEHRGELEPLVSDRLLSPARFPHLSGADGEFIREETARAYLEESIHRILARPVRIDDFTRACRGHIKASTAQKWRVLPIAQVAAAKALAQELRAVDGKEVSLDLSFCQDNVSHNTSPRRVPIAIVGMAGRFPGASDPDELWNILRNGKDVHSKIPTDRFDSETHLEKPAFGAFIEQPGLFDNGYFRMSPREALQTDPGQRLALVTALEALEMSGFVPDRTPSTRRERVGTFFGQVTDEYKEQNLSQEVSTYYIPGSLRSFGPGRIHHFFKFGGPSMLVDTACSASLSALHVACNSIWSGECDTAIVGGMNILTGADNFNGLIAGHFLSPTGGCKTFDDGADGYCRGETVASLIIKPLSEAIADNDHILANILSISTNYSHGAVSITHPWAPAQESLYNRVLSDAAIEARDVNYVEMHGTGTQAGDFEEMTSVLNVFAPTSSSRGMSNPLVVGSVKSNVGHGESASGVTAIIKALLMLKEREIPTHCGIKGAINHKFPDLNSVNVCIPRSTQQFSTMFPQPDKFRFLINNFSASGMNTACIVEEAPRRTPSNSKRTGRNEHVIAVSGKSASALRNNLGRLASYIQRNSSVSIDDLSYTTTARRTHHARRWSVLASNLQDLALKLKLASGEENFVSAQKPKNTCFVFTGQGSFHIEGARKLFASSPVFQDRISRYCAIAVSLGFPTFISLLHGTRQTEQASIVEVHLCALAIQMALYQLFMSFGVTASAVTGHSFGEYSALFAAGVLSAQDAIYLVGKRAGLLERLHVSDECMMLSVRADISEVQLLTQRQSSSLEVACKNGPRQYILAGPRVEIEEAANQLKSRSVACSVLQLPFAYHTKQMDPILEDLEAELSKVQFKAPKIPVISPYLARVVTDGSVFNARYVREQTRGCVNFAGGIQEYAASLGPDVASTMWLEIGTHPLCTGMLRETLGNDVMAFPSLKKNTDAWTTIQTTLSSLYLSGCDIKWQELYRGSEKDRQLLHLPAYSWDSKNFWIPYKNDWILQRNSPNVLPAPSMNQGPNTATVHTLLKEETVGSLHTMTFESDLAQTDLYTLIKGHAVNGVYLCPASVFADIFMTVADFMHSKISSKEEKPGLSVEGIEILHPITVPTVQPSQPQKLKIIAVSDATTGVVDITLQDDWSPSRGETKARGQVKFKDQTQWKSKWERSSYLLEGRVRDLKNGLEQGQSQKLMCDLVYMLFSSLVTYSPMYYGIQQMVVNSQTLEAVATVHMSDASSVSRYHMYPPWVDSIVQVAGIVMNGNPKINAQGAAFICNGWKTLRLLTDIDVSKAYEVHVRMQPTDARERVYVGTLSLMEGSSVIGQIKDVQFMRIPRAHLDTLLSAPSHPKASNNLNTTSSPSIPMTAVPQAHVSRIQADELQTTVQVLPPQSAKTEQSDGRMIMERIFNILAEEVGINSTELEESTEFSNLGVDSLLSLTVLARTKTSLGIDLPQEAFMQYPDVKSLRQFILQTYGTSNPELSPTQQNETNLSAKEISDFRETYHQVFNGGASQRNSYERQYIGMIPKDDLYAQPSADASRLSISDEDTSPIPTPSTSNSYGTSSVLPSPPSWSSNAADQQKSSGLQLLKGASNPERPPTRLSVVLQGELSSAKPALFLFPDGSGSAGSYAHLLPISPDTCLVGLNSPYRGAGSEAGFSIESIAEQWVAEIRSRQPAGPYDIGGWSAGGYYAFEAMKMLTNAGESVRNLVLIDSPPRNVYEPLTRSISDLVFGKSSSQSETGTEPIGVANATASQPEIKLSQRTLDHFACTMSAVERYQPQPAFDGANLLDDMKVTILWATDGVLGNAVSGTNAQGSVELRRTNKLARFLLEPRSALLDPSSADGHGGGWEKLLPMSSKTKIEICSVPGHHFNLLTPPHSEAMSRVIRRVLTGRAE